MGREKTPNNWYKKESPLSKKRRGASGAEVTYLPSVKSNITKSQSPYIDFAWSWISQANDAYKVTKTLSLRKYADYNPDWWLSKLDRNIARDKRFDEMSGEKKRDIVELMIRHFWKNWLADWQDAEKEFFTLLWDDLVEESLMSYRIRHTPRVTGTLGMSPEERQAKRDKNGPTRPAHFDKKLWASMSVDERKELMASRRGLNG